MSIPPVGKYSSDRSIGCSDSRLFHHLLAAADAVLQFFMKPLKGWKHRGCSRIASGSNTHATLLPCSRDAETQSSRGTRSRQVLHPPGQKTVSTKAGNPGEGAVCLAGSRVNRRPPFSSLVRCTLKPNCAQKYHYSHRF